MTARGVPRLSGKLGLVGAHISFLGGGVGLLFLQRYIWLLGLAARGYGPYQTLSYLISVSAVAVLLDLAILWWALRRSRPERILSVLWPALFFSGVLIVVLANNI